MHKVSPGKSRSDRSSVRVESHGDRLPDISREVPVISLANGRIVDIKARLGDNVSKGQLLLKVQSPDITNAFNAYLKASNDEQVANKAYLRAQDLFQHGAISQAMLEQAEGAEKDAVADKTAAEDQLKTLGVDKDHPSSVVNVYAPITGVIIAQNVTNAAAVGVTLAGSATAFTIADLSSVWILCDVYENDIPKIQVGQEARIKMGAYPDRSYRPRQRHWSRARSFASHRQGSHPGSQSGHPQARHVRHGHILKSQEVTFTVVPADAVLHLHDRDWVYMPAGDKQFRRVEVRAGKMLEGNRQEILSGLQPGQQVVTKALLLETAGNQ